MNTQTLTNPVMTCNFVFALPEAKFPIESPILASSRDYGFDFDEEEIAREMLAPLPASFADQPIPDVGANEFEQAFQYFFS